MYMDKISDAWKIKPESDGLTIHSDLEPIRLVQNMPYSKALQLKKAHPFHCMYLKSFFQVNHRGIKRIIAIESTHFARLKG